MVTSEDFRRKFQTEPSEWKNSLTSLLSSHKAALETTQNKDQFIYIKCNSLQSDSKENRLMTTGKEKNLRYSFFSFFLCRRYSEPALKGLQTTCAAALELPKLCIGTELTLELKLRTNSMKLKRAKEGKKIPPIPGFEPQVSRCLVRATLSSPPGGMDMK